MLKKKNHIGRPSNKEIRAMKNKKIFIAAISIVFVLLVVGMFETGSLSKLMGNSVTEYYCEDGYKLKGDKCIKSVREKPYKIGDVNKDGRLNINDFTDVQRYLAEYITFDDYQMILADVNKDGKVSVLDLTLLQKYLIESQSGTLGAEHHIGERACPKNTRRSGAYCYTDITVDAKIKKEYTEYKIGDMITYHGIDFQVIKDSSKNDSMITMIKSTPLTSEEITALGEQYAASSVNGIVELTGENEYNETYSTSVVKSIVDVWATSNSLLVNINDNARLITNDELINNLKYKVTGAANVGYVLNFETGSIDWTINPYWVYSGNNVTKYEFVPSSTTGLGSSGTGAYVRPVIEISKSNFWE